MLSNLYGTRDITKVVNDASVPYYTLLRSPNPNAFTDNRTGSEVLKFFEVKIKVLHADVLLPALFHRCQYALEVAVT